MRRMEMINFLENITEHKDYYLIALLTTYLVAGVVDWSFGWLNARFNKNVQFESGVALYGIIKKMMYFVGMALFMVIAFMVVPIPVAYTAVTALFIGVILSEANSIASHLGYTQDGKKGEIFKDFIKRIFDGNNSEK